MHGVGARLPDTVKTLVAATERTGIFKVTHYGDCPHFLELHRPVWLGKVNPHETVAGIADFHRAHHRKRDYLVAHGVVVRCPALASDIGHGLGRRLSVAYPDLDRTARKPPRHNMKPAVQFLPVVQQHSGGGTVLRREDAVGCRRVVIAVWLPVALFQEHVGKLHALTALPNNTGRRDVGSDTHVAFLRVNDSCSAKQNGY